MQLRRPYEVGGPQAHANCGELFWKKKQFFSAVLRSFHLSLKFASMREMFILIAGLMLTLAKLARPGGLGAVAAESLAVKPLEGLATSCKSHTPFR